MVIPNFRVNFREYSLQYILAMIIIIPTHSTHFTLSVLGTQYW